MEGAYQKRQVLFTAMIAQEAEQQAVSGAQRRAQFAVAAGAEAGSVHAVADEAQLCGGNPVLPGSNPNQRAGIDHRGVNPFEQKAAGEDAAALQPLRFIRSESGLVVNDGAERLPGSGQNGIEGTPVVSEQQVGPGGLERRAERQRKQRPATGRGSDAGDGDVRLNPTGRVEAAVEGHDAVPEGGSQGVDDADHAQFGAAFTERRKYVKQMCRGIHRSKSPLL